MKKNNTEIAPLQSGGAIKKDKAVRSVRMNADEILSGMQTLEISDETKLFIYVYDKLSEVWNDFDVAYAKTWSKSDNRYNDEVFVEFDRLHDNITDFVLKQTSESIRQNRGFLDCNKI